MRVSAGELELLSLLWTRGPLSIAEARAAFPRTIGYTTVQTRLNRLVAKGLARRGDERPARYRALVAPESIGADHLDLLVERVAGGQVVPLVAHLVQSGPLSRDEIDELKRLIEEAEERLGDDDDEDEREGLEPETEDAP